MRRFLAPLGSCLLMSLLAVGLWTTAGAAGLNPDTLRVALLPDESPSTIIKNNKGLKRYLEEKTGKRVKLVVTTDYSSMIEAMRRGRLELAYFGPLSYMLAKSKSDIEPFAALLKKGSTTYRSVLIANRKAGVISIADIRGKEVAFGDTASTSSHLIPKSMLANANLLAKRDYREHFLGTHDAVAVSVQNGKAQAGGLSKPIFDSLVGRGIITMDKVRVIQILKPFPQCPWTMRSDLGPALKERVRNAFYSLRDKKVLKPFKADGFAPIHDQDYDVVRDLAKLLRLDLSS